MERKFNETHVIIKVHHTGIDEALILKKAQELAVELHDRLNGIEEYELVYVHGEHVTVHTAPFEVE